MRGKFIAVEGPDGSGKSEQQKLLVRRFRDEGIVVSTADFPQYESSLFGAMAGRLLSGQLGNIETIHPELAALVYAADRWKAAGEIRKKMDDGEMVVANRYALSNMAHQSARLPESERNKFIELLHRMEFDEKEGFGIPVPDVYVHLRVPSEISRELILKKAERAYLENGRKRDQLEEDLKHQIEAAAMYELLADKMDNILTIECCETDGTLKTIEAIHGLVYSEVCSALRLPLREGIIHQERQ